MSQPSAVTDDVAERVVAAFEKLPQLTTAAPDLVRRGRFLSCDFEIGVGSISLSVAVVEGRVTAVRRGPFLLKSHAFSICAEPDAWARFHEAFPSPGFHDLFAMTKAGRAHISGDLVPLMGNLQYVKDLIALPRPFASRDAGT